MVGILEGGKKKKKKRAKQRPLSRRSTTTSIYSNRAWRSFSLTLLEAQAPPLPGRRLRCTRVPCGHPSVLRRQRSYPPSPTLATPHCLPRSPSSSGGFPQDPASMRLFASFFSFLDRVLVLPPRYVTCPFFSFASFSFSSSLSILHDLMPIFLVGGSGKSSSGQSSWCSLGLKKRRALVTTVVSRTSKRGYT